MGLLLACANPPLDDEVIEIPYLGQFDAISAVSNMAIDGNFDGIYSTDYYEEFAWYRRPLPPNLRAIRLTNLGDAFFILSTPIMFRWPEAYESPDTKVIDNMTYLSFNHTNSEIINSTPMTTRDGEPTKTEIMAYKIIDNDTIYIELNHDQIYDIKTEKWITIIVKFIFKRR